VLRGAIAVADAGGLTGLTMRSLAEELGVKPMAVYHHVKDEDEILDGIIDMVWVRSTSLRRTGLEVRAQASWLSALFVLGAILGPRRCWTRG
jgi:AcrR family transcriptional regulator